MQQYRETTDRHVAYVAFLKFGEDGQKIRGII